MAQIKIYGERDHLRHHRQALSAAIHKTLMDVIGLPATKRFQRFLPLERDDFIHPADRSGAYTILEISMFEGRDAATKRRLIETLIARISADVGIAEADLEITLFETPRSHWGIRGKVADRLHLDYRVET